MFTTPMWDAETNSSSTNLSVGDFFDRLCVKERNFVGENVPLLFVGDRGYGIHSAIKEYMRCGGAWEAKKHSHHCPVIITNDHNTSQTRLLAYSKMSHLQKLLVAKKNKQHLRSVNESKTEKLKTLAKAFCARNTFDPASSTEL